MPGYYPLNAYYPLLEILVLSFGAILFGLLSFYLLGRMRRRGAGWGGLLYPASVLTLTFIFLAHLGYHFAAGLQKPPGGLIWSTEMAGKHMLPALVFHLFYRNEKAYLRAPRLWRFLLVLVYALGLVSAAAALNVSVTGWFDGYPGWPAVAVLGSACMVCGAAGSGLALYLSRRPIGSALERNQQRWLVASCGLWVAAFLLGGLLPPALAETLERAPALLFIFVITYYVERFTFFDVLIKKGVFISASLCLLTLEFVFVAPLLVHLQLRTWIGSLAWALLVWPVVLLAPWGHRTLSAWLDRVWLGRRFSPAAATRYFLEGVDSSINEDELAQRAAERLGTIFASRAGVSFSKPAAVQEISGECMIAPIRLGSRPIGEIRIHPREHNPRFLSEDVMLLASLADGLAFLLENLRLREKRLEQEKRENDLILNANRSELKALRAQVNPHFLFNALNTIAALIPRHPTRAEETIEELAEVFRYALHRSQREWVRVEDEIGAVQAYLRVEQARFGEMLQAQVTVSPEARDVRIPAMAIQTLADNAVKHGISGLTAPGRVDIRAYVDGRRLRVEVRDSGRGFEDSVLEQPQQTGGYGLRNVRDRLRGYFGDAGVLAIGRDSECDMTLVSIEMPLGAVKV